MHMRLYNIRLFGKNTSFWPMFFFMVLMVSGCQHAPVETKQTNIEQMLNSGLQEHIMRLNESIIINTSPESAKWQVSLGKRDFKQAEFTHFKNNVQASFKLTKIGAYRVSLGTFRQSGQGNTMMHTLVIVVR